METRMKTNILKPTEENIALCANAIKAGELVAFPTETVYALGCDAKNGAAVKNVYTVKGRPSDKALIVAVAKKSDISTVVKSIPQKAHTLIEKFMPGALTLVMDKADCIPAEVSAGTDSVAVRIPDNKIALRLIELSGTPIVVPSANTSERPSPTLAGHVKDDLDGKIKYILDGGASDIGIESTVIDMRNDPPTVLRVGGVAVDDIEREIGKVECKRESTKLAYTPNAEVLFSAYYEGMERNIAAKYDALEANGVSAVILCLDGNREKYGNRNVYTVGADYKEYAHNLFALLRRADGLHYETVIAEGVNPFGIGKSLVARLVKLSGGLII